MPDRTAAVGSNSHVSTSAFCVRYALQLALKSRSRNLAWWYTVETINWLSTMASQAWLDRFDEGLTFVRAEFAQTPLPLSMAHGDFAPGNMCRNSDGSLFVFDWEDAVQEGLPLQDWFHFHALSCANAGLRYDVDVEVTKAIASRILGLAAINAINLDALFTLYLIYVGSGYLKASLEMPTAGTMMFLTWVSREMDVVMERETFPCS